MRKTFIALLSAVAIVACASPPELQAAIDGDTAGLRELIETGKGDVDTRDLNGMMPIHFAAGQGNLETFRYLVDAGSDVDAIDNHGRTPLFLASGNGEKEVVKYLLELGADPAVPTKKLGYWGVYDTNLTALHNAVGNGRVEIVKLLIDSGADVSSRTGRGLTPLSLANATNPNLGLAREPQDTRATIVKLLNASDAAAGGDFDLIIAESEQAAAVAAAARNPNLTLAQRNEAVRCGETELVNMSSDQAKAISHLLYRKNHPGEQFCIDKLEGVDSFELRGDTVVEYIVTVSFPIGYHSKCLGYEQRVERVNRNFNWGDFNDVTAGGCNAFSIMSAGYYFKGPHKPGTVMRFSGEETI